MYILKGLAQIQKVYLSIATELMLRTCAELTLYVSNKCIRRKLSYKNLEWYSISRFQIRNRFSAAKNRSYRRSCKSLLMIMY